MEAVKRISSHAGQFSGIHARGSRHSLGESGARRRKEDVGERRPASGENHQKARHLRGRRPWLAKWVEGHRQGAGKKAEVKSA